MNPRVFHSGDTCEWDDHARRQNECDAQLQAHQASLQTWCRKLLAKPEDAEDAAQEVMLLACKNWHSFRGESSVARWLYKIARNHCMNCNRNAHNRTVSLDGPTAPQVEAPIDTSDSIQSVDRQLLHCQLLKAIEAEAASRKPPWDTLDWLIFQAYYGEGKRSWVEVAAIVKRPVDTVKDRFYRRIEPTFNTIRKKFDE